MKENSQKFEKIFKIVSYTVAFSGLFSLFVSGGVGIVVTTLALSAFVLAWFIEDSGWQIKERIGLVLILSAIPLFYIDWKFQIFGAIGTGFMAIGSLARLILFLCVVKLLQKKSDRDWIFIYVISFFEILLAASVSISPLYVVSLLLFLLSSICAIILFEIRKTFRKINDQKNDAALVNTHKIETFSAKRLPVTAVALLLAIMLFALPLFFAFPRVGGAGFGNSSSGNRVTGFSDSVKLGEIGSLLQNDEIVMRVEFEQGDFQNLTNPRWRGVALDKFDNKTWSKTSYGNLERFAKTESGFYIVDFPREDKNLVKYTVYLEPLETSVLFALSRPVVISRGNFQDVRKDDEGAIKVTRNGFEPTAYSVVSDVSQPATEKLKTDNSRYSQEISRYLQLPENFDERISRFTEQITNGKTNRYEKAKAVENYLQNNFGYTLELKAGGEQPLSDFLFNVREGHCEYFASSMAIMLRTQGIATRVVNGFQTGEYNAAAGVYIVKQKDAHSWVEVYFPKENAWIPFDPTPFSGRTDAANAAASNGIAGKFNTYLVALETFWIQYFVAYDDQEQRSLFSSVKTGFNKYQAKSSFWLNNAQERILEWWKEVRGDKGFEMSIIAIGYAVGYVSAFVLGTIFLIWLYRKLRKSEFWQKFVGWLKSKNDATIIEFYERMQKVLAGKGLVRADHQTPLEFAFALQMPEAVSITEKYNRVRFGEKDLSSNEAKEVENWLTELNLKLTNYRTLKLIKSKKNMKQSKIIILILIVLGIQNIIFAQKSKQPKIVKNGVLEEKLFEALHNDEFEKVKKLIADGANVNALDEGSSWRPLHFAVYGHRLELVKILLQKKAQINVREIDGATPLNLVFTNSDKIKLDTVEITKALIAAGADVNLMTKHNVTPLINAVRELNVEIEAVKLLLLNKANVDAVDADGNFALQLAVTAGRDDLAELLRPLSKNKIVKNIEKPDDATFVAECDKGNWLRIKKMIELGANINAVDSAGRTGLHSAAKNSDLMTVELLIKNNAKLNIKDSEGYTALLRAADSSDYSGKNAEVIEALLDAGENAAAKTSSGETSVLLLLNTNPDHITSLKKLLAHDVDLKQKNFAGQTALMLAVAYELELPVIKLMLEKGSDPNQIDEFGENALQIAMFTERKDTVELLKPLTKITENRSQLPGKFFDPGAGEMYYEVHGASKTGTPLFVLHGGPGFDHKYLLSSDAFIKLAENRPVIFYDQRGSGNSTHLTKSGTATIFELVEDLDKLRKHLGYRKIDVLGHSWGGYLAMAYGVQYPQNVEKLVLCDSVSPEYDDKTDDFVTAYPVESAEMRKSLHGSREYILAYMKMLFYSKEKRDSFIKGSSDYTYSRFANSTIGESASKTHIFGKLSDFNFPVLVINGRHDSNILPEIAVGISKEIPNSQLVIFENSGHLPFYEEPQKFVEIVGDFLNGKKVSYK